MYPASIDNSVFYIFYGCLVTQIYVIPFYRITSLNEFQTIYCIHWSSNRSLNSCYQDEGDIHLAKLSRIPSHLLYLKTYAIYFALYRVLLITFRLQSTFIQKHSRTLFVLSVFLFIQFLDSAS